jgi:hypothetical protein
MMNRFVLVNAILVSVSVRADEPKLIKELEPFEWMLGIWQPTKLVDDANWKIVHATSITVHAGKDGKSIQTKQSLKLLFRMFPISAQDFAVTETISWSEERKMHKVVIAVSGNEKREVVRYLKQVDERKWRTETEEGTTLDQPFECSKNGREIRRWLPFVSPYFNESNGLIFIGAMTGGYR